jgi:glycerol-3-phosphate cytidylyltransferase-like family protein
MNLWVVRRMVRWSFLRKHVMPQLIKVCCVGSNVDVLRTRLLVLESAGFAVSGAPPSDAIASIRAAGADVVVLGADVGDKDAATIEAEVQPKVRVVRLNGFTHPLELIALVQQ